MPNRKNYCDDDSALIKSLIEQGNSVSEIAQRMGRSEKSVVSAFKRHTGMTITDFRYFLLPLSSFKILLAEGCSVNEVAESTGCSDHQIRSAIKRTEGMSIAEFRESHGLTTTGEEEQEAEVNERDAVQKSLRRLRLPTSNRRIGRPSKTYDKQCQFCGVAFTTKNNKRRFCSHSCSVKSRPATQRKTVRRLVRKKCECCGKVYQTKRAEQKYCGNECRKKRISRDKTILTDTPCAYCEQLFRPAQRIQRFCSRDCAYKGKRSSSLVYGNFKLSENNYVRFESSFELVFLLFARQHMSDFQCLFRCDFTLDYQFDGQRFRYLPDFLCVGADGRQKLIEVKSTGTKAWHPEKAKAKLDTGRLWCNENDADFIYLSDEIPAFIDMCDFVSSQHGLDVLQYVEDGDALRKIMKRCVECGKRIPRRGKGIADYLQRKFCSATCRNKSKHGKKQPLPSSKHVCPQCGKHFIGHSEKTFCSKDCYSASQRTLKETTCPVCGKAFQPNSSSQRTCGIECGIVFRAATRKGVSVAEYVEWKAKNKPAEMRNCIECGDGFTPRSHATVLCLPCRKIARTVWTLDVMTQRLTEIRDYLGGRIPAYSEIYESPELRERFNSCSLAGAIYRFNQGHGLRSYQEFVKVHLDWTLVGKLTEARTKEVLELMIDSYGGVPIGIGQIDDLFGHKGHAFEEAFKSHCGVTLREYCEQHGIARIERSQLKAGRGQ